jgi:phosphoribosyl 1,2-cyclic phosphodiesterase
MSLSLCVLASGSSGNCSVIRAQGGAMLIDCGIGPRTAAGRLKGTGVSINDIAAICLTHLDRDHFNLNWVETVVRNQVRVYCAADRAADLRRFADDDAFAERIEPFDDEAFEPLPGVSVSSQQLAHDQTGSHAFIVESNNARIGYATDLGRVPAELIERFCGVDLLAIESNYDPQMQQTSGRPRFLQQRIMGGRGHLSNDQALAAVRAVLDRCQRKANRLPRHIVLLHRSRQCNCPDLLRELFSRDTRISSRLMLAEQFFRTPWLSAEPARQWMGEQLSLSFA